jgi:hypothetical protein
MMLLFSTMVVLTCVWTGGARKAEADLALIGRLRANRVVMHLERDARSLGKELAVAVAPDHRLEPGE